MRRWIQEPKVPRYELGYFNPLRHHRLLLEYVKHRPGPRRMDRGFTPDPLHQPMVSEAASASLSGKDRRWKPKPAPKARYKGADTNIYFNQRPLKPR